MRKMLIAAAILAGAPGVHAAGIPMVDLYLGVNGWQSQTSGSFFSSDPNDTDIDMEDDLGFDKDTQTIAYLGLEHPVPVLPNIRLRQISLSDSETNTLSQQITFDGKSYNSEVTSEYDLDMTDITLYYQPLDNWLVLNLGLNIRQVDATFSIKDSGSSSELTAKKTLPQLHVAARGNLPFSGFYVSGEINTISYDSNKFQDINVNVGWQSDFFLALELGYNAVNLELDAVDELYTDLEFSGPYLGMSLNF